MINMAEFYGEVEEEYESDVDIDFSKFTSKQRTEIIAKIMNKEVVTFKDVNLVFSGEVCIDVDPPDYY